MTMISRVVVVFLLVQLTNASDKQIEILEPADVNAKDAVKRHFQDLSFLGRGYNLLAGNPGSGSDYGVESAIFKIEYRDDKETSVPFGVDAMRTPSCDMMFKSSRITDMKTYTEQLKLSVSGNISLIAAPFSANAEYNDMEQFMSNYSSVFVETVADCMQYSARLNVYADKPPLTPNFENALSKLPSVYDSHDPECVDAFNAFFFEFGTHVVIQVSMGTKLILRHEMSESKFRDLEGKGMSINMAASIFSMLQFDPVPAEFPFITSEMLELEAKLFGEKRTTTILISKGAKVPHEANLDQWLKDSSNDPALLRFQLEPMHYHVPEHLKTAITMAVKEFCKHVPNAKCEQLFSEAKKLDPLCPRVHYSGNWTSRHECFKGSKPAPPDHVVDLFCPHADAMAGLRFSHRRLPLKRSYTGLVDIGCTNIVDPSMKLFANQWTEPKRKTKSVMECPRGQLVTGIRLSHKCNSNHLQKEYVSLRCAKASSAIGQCRLTDWESAESLPAWTESNCPPGTILKGLHFRFKKDQEQYRLRCCEAGKVPCADVIKEEE